MRNKKGDSSMKKITTTIFSLLIASNVFALDKTFMFNEIFETIVMVVPNYSSMHPAARPLNSNTAIKIAGRDPSGLSMEVWISGSPGFSLSDQSFISSCEQKALLVQSNPKKYSLRVHLQNFSSLPIAAGTITSLALSSEKNPTGDIFCSLLSKSEFGVERSQ